MGCLNNIRMGMNEIRLTKNLQNVSVSEGKIPAIALPETQLPPQIIIETTTERLNSRVLFEFCFFTSGMADNVAAPQCAGHSYRAGLFWHFYIFRSLNGIKPLMSLL